jgi:hypothetical protein
MFCCRLLMLSLIAGAAAPCAGGLYRSAFTRIFSFGIGTANRLCS